MSKAFNTAIVIRSFGFQSDAYKKLDNATHLVFTNKSGQRLSEEDLIRAISEADGIIAGTESYNKKVLSSAPHLKVISRVGVGLDNIDLEYAALKGISVVNTPLAPTDAVAEHTLALILSLMKRIPRYYTKIREGDFSIYQGSLVKGKTAGIIGMGRIGQKVAGFLAALGAGIVYFDPFSPRGIPDEWHRADNLEDLLRISDIISLHCPPREGNLPILDREAFAKCKPGVIVINTARGSLIDEKSLIQAIDEGIVASAGLDVVSTEPYKGPLLDYPQIVITPHVASNTLESRQQMEIEAVENMLHIFGI
jgi:D-3-phosphoglycerate dehydrogenase